MNAADTEIYPMGERNKSRLQKFVMYQAVIVLLVICFRKHQSPWEVHDKRFWDGYLTNLVFLIQRVPNTLLQDPQASILKVSIRSDLQLEQCRSMVVVSNLLLEPDL